MNKLNLGSGRFKKPGYVNLDVNPACSPDVVHDLGRFPYPFPDSYFDLVEADHVVEHLEDPLGAMKEIHCILKSSGLLVLRVPHFSRGFTHAEHKRGFDVLFPYYFTPTFEGGYAGVEFELKSMRLTWFAQPYLKRTVMSVPSYYAGMAIGKVFDFFANASPKLCNRLWCFWVGGFEQIEFQFICRKPTEAAVLH